MSGISRRSFVTGAVVAGFTVRALPSRVEESRTISKSDPDRTAQEVQRSTLVVDGLDPSSLNVDYLNLLRVGGVNCWHHSVGGDFASFATLLEFFDQHKARIAAARSVREIRQLHRDGRISHVAGWQSADDLLVSGVPEIRNLRAYHELGLKICGISYNVAGAFGGGCFDAEVPLTRAGRRLVEEIHRLGIVLDVGGHTGERTSFDALAVSTGVPVICSHTNLRALNDNPRCSSDRLIETIARTGGVIGLSAFNDFHARKASDFKILRTPQVGLERHLDQYDYLKRLVGVEHIGISPDFIEGRNDPGTLSAADHILMAPEAYSQEMPWFYVKGFENIGQLPNVTQGLLQRGWSSAEVRKVLGENWLRVYEKVWGA